MVRYIMYKCITLESPKHLINVYTNHCNKLLFVIHQGKLQVH